MTTEDAMVIHFGLRVVDRAADDAFAVIIHC